MRIWIKLVGGPLDGKQETRVIDMGVLPHFLNFVLDDKKPNYDVEGTVPCDDFILKYTYQLVNRRSDGLYQYDYVEGGG